MHNIAYRGRRHLSILFSILNGSRPNIIIALLMQLKVRHYILPFVRLDLCLNLSLVCKKLPKATVYCTLFFTYRETYRYRGIQQRYRILHAFLISCRLTTHTHTHTQTHTSQVLVYL